MAALGAFRTLNARPEYSGSRLKWIPHGSAHSPVLQTPSEVSLETLLDHLHESLCAVAGHQILTFEKDLKVAKKPFRHLSETMAENFLDNGEDFGSAMVAAFGCDAITTDDGLIEDTAFRTMSGAGHQHFLAFMNDLAQETTLEQLREAILGPWRYRDPSPTMRWDDADDRRYALRWDEPSKDPVRTVRGANRLAVAALPLFSTFPGAKGSLVTTSFKGGKSNNTFITWPIWDRWLSLDSVQSVLLLSELQKSTPSYSELSARGICAVFQSQRITLGKYRNFTPAKAL